MSNAVVSNDDKRQNCKGDIAHLVVDLRTKLENGWETSPGCRHNHVKPWEGDEIGENNIKGVQEEDQQLVAEKKLYPVVRVVGLVGKDPVGDRCQKLKEEGQGLKLWKWMEWTHREIWFHEKQHHG